ncbi:uncharacterized protein N7496_007359 [Penicillium cataractarum]|uniref:Uncharacterized protein n=1 Tax=Penicillium cataractarum TaxID=2100454 RepID=A0A9W9S421_9EURO|nr:uncharacterized protein N7496_007359 [Penicillium cataractarum]KAJ5371267.1 hypothetical protein N7496_007359 [Penicillium cataractarum]
MESEELDILDPDQLLGLIEALKTNDPQKKKAFPTVFYTGGHWAGRVRPQYFEFALMTDLKSVRYVSDEVLDKLIPEWREYMNGKSFPSNAKAHEASFRAWCVRERAQYEANGVPFPRSSSKRRATATAAALGARTTQGSAQPSATMGQRGQAMNVRSISAPAINAQARNTPVRNAPAVNAPITNASARNLPSMNALATNAPAMIAPLMNAPAMNAPARNTLPRNAPVRNTVTANVQDLQAAAIRLEHLGRNTHQFADMLRQHGQRELRVAELLLQASRARQEQPPKE